MRCLLWGSMAVGALLGGAIWAGVSGRAALWVGAAGMVVSCSPVMGLPRTTPPN